MSGGRGRGSGRDRGGRCRVRDGCRRGRRLRRGVGRLRRGRLWRRDHHRRRAAVALSPEAGHDLTRLSGRRVGRRLGRGVRRRGGGRGGSRTLCRRVSRSRGVGRIRVGRRRIGRRRTRSGRGRHRRRRSDGLRGRPVHGTHQGLPVLLLPAEAVVLPQVLDRGEAPDPVDLLDRVHEGRLPDRHRFAPAREPLLEVPHLPDHGPQRRGVDRDPGRLELRAETRAGHRGIGRDRLHERSDHVLEHDSLEGRPRIGQITQSVLDLLANRRRVFPAIADELVRRRVPGAVEDRGVDAERRGPHRDRDADLGEVVFGLDELVAHGLDDLSPLGLEIAPDLLPRTAEAGGVGGPALREQVVSPLAVRLRVRGAPLE